jgi:hypothetical protein
MSDMKKWKQLIESASKAIVENPVEDTDYTDHEVSMAKSQLLSTVKSATRIAKHLKNLSEEEGLEGWVASKITMAEDYLQAVADYMDGEDLQEGYKILPQIDNDKYPEINGLEGPFRTLNGAVVYYDPKEGKYYDKDRDMYLSYEEFRQMDTDYSGMKDERDIPVKEESASWHDILGGDLPNGIDYDFNNLPKVNWSQYSKEDIAKFVDHLENLDFEDGVDVSGSGYDGMYRKAIKWVEKNLMGKK